LIKELNKVLELTNKLFKLNELEAIVIQKKEYLLEQNYNFNSQKKSRLLKVLANIKILNILLLVFNFSLSVLLGFNLLEASRKKISKISKDVAFFPIEGNEVLLSFLSKELPELNFNIWVQGIWPSQPTEYFKTTNLLIFQCLNTLVLKSLSPMPIYYSCSYDGNIWSFFVIFEQPLMGSSTLHFKILEDYLISIGGKIEFLAIPQTKIKIYLPD
jgi:hypothetical protein